jgi:precorrin-6A synthase
VRRLSVVGVGAGDPDHVTVQAIRALERADVLFELDRATTDLTTARAVLLARHLPPERTPAIVTVDEPRRDRAAVDYGQAVAAWRAARADAWETAIADHLGEDGCGAFVVWGDPSLYDSTIAVLDDVLARGRVAFRVEVIPGISSLHALTARHRIPLAGVGGSVLVTTGRRLRERGWPAAEIEDVVVMLDRGGAFRAVLDMPLDIYWGAYLGTEAELLIAGPLHEVADEIERVRAAARASKGWVMDVYLLRLRSRE